jgi:argonaute-like protein implicated in RNA metabolism and viral defense
MEAGSELAEDEGEEGAEQVRRLDFHDLLKAQAMFLRKPVQVIRPSTYDETLARRQRLRSDRPRKLQDEATKAWNIFTALYYKAGGTPWRLVRDASDYVTCFVGVSFYVSLDGSSLMTSVAQVFNQRGEGVVLRGGKAKLTKEDKHPYLAAEDAHALLSSALDTFRQTHRHMPARVVLHKSSPITPEECAAFAAAARERRVEFVDMLSVSKTYTRLFRDGTYPPRRGTLLNLDESTSILYTRGSVEFFATYPGLYVPLPILLRHATVSQSTRFLAQEVLALTKMNWNNTQFDGADPITLRAADQVGSILKYVGADDPVEPRYCFYM